MTIANPEQRRQALDSLVEYQNKFKKPFERGKSPVFSMNDEFMLVVTNLVVAETLLDLLDEVKQLRGEIAAGRSS